MKELECTKILVDDRVQPIPGMIKIPGTDTQYLYLYEKNLYEAGIGIGSVRPIWGISV